VVGATGKAQPKRAERCDMGFLPENLVTRCRMVVESYHASHGYSCLPDILWKARLGPFIERDPTLRQLLRKASTAKSAKKANEGFVAIAAAILSLEILASSFAGWSGLFPEAGRKARALLERSADGRSPLMEHYVYPPKYSNVFAKLSPPSAVRTSAISMWKYPIG
jgi:hypothetical protein